MSGQPIGVQPTAAHPPGNAAAQYAVDMGAARDQYCSQLEAARSDGNRFMRRRDGLGLAAAARYSEFDLWRVREIARHMVDNDAIPGLMTRRCADNIVQQGFRPKPDTGDPGLDEELLGRWNDWARDPHQVDYYGRWDFAQMEWHVFRQALSDGEMLGLPLRSGHIQVLEADHLVSPAGVLRSSGMGATGNPNDFVAGGIRFLRGQPASMYLVDAPPQGPWLTSRSLTTPKSIDIVDPQGFRNVLHVYLPHRVAQWRGYSAFHPIMVETGMLDDLDFATLLKAQVSASIAGVIQSADPEAADGGSAWGGDSTTEKGPSGAQQRLERMQFGMFLRLMDDEKLGGFSSPIPYDGHMKHAVYLMRKIGSSALDLPYELILLDGSITNFSGWKGAVDQARQCFRRAQRHFAASWHHHLWRWRARRMLPRLGEAARAKALDGSLYRHQWVPPTWESIQRLQDAQADAVLLGENLASPRETAAARGRDYTDIIRETVEDNGAAIEAAIAIAEKINASHPNAHVDWREVIRWAQPGGVTFSGALGDDQATATPNREDRTA